MSSIKSKIVKSAFDPLLKSHLRNRQGKITIVSPVNSMPPLQRKTFTITNK